MAGRTPAPCATMPTRYYAYVDRVMLHEFGQTLGLPDFYSRTGAPRLDGLDGETAIMNEHWNAKSIQNADIEQLDAIYRRHSSHSAK